MKTRDRILDAARQLFNTQGVAQISMRDIAGHLDMSVGNLWYHFKTKDLIVAELYQQLMGDMHTQVQQIPAERDSIVSLLESHRLMFSVQYRYKFFYLNLYDVLDQHPSVKDLYVQFSQQNREVAKGFLMEYEQSGVFARPLTDRERNQLITSGQMLNNTWAIDAELFYGGDAQGKLLHYMQICCQLFYPYLSTEAQQAYDSYFQALESQTGMSTVAS
ncbi:MAG: TetR/AcrR family transcriptional regulator [Bacteroidota bacterium]